MLLVKWCELIWSFYQINPRHFITLFIAVHCLPVSPGMKKSDQQFKVELGCFPN